VITIQDGVAQISIVTLSAANGVTEIVSNDTPAVTSEHLTVSDNLLSIQNKSDSNSAPTPINVLPNRIADSANANFNLKRIEKIELKTEQDKAFYIVHGVREVKLLFFIPIDMPIDVKFDANNAEMVSVSKPWWSFFFFL